jgi:hypothetical protein
MVFPHKDLLYSAILIASGVMLFSKACSEPTSPDREMIVSVSYDDFEKNHNYSGNVQLSAGGTLTVRLFSNATTDFMWMDPAKISHPSVFVQTSHEYIPPSVPNAGAGGARGVDVSRRQQRSMHDLNGIYAALRYASYLDLHISGHGHVSHVRTGGVPKWGEKAGRDSLCRV